MNNRDSEKVILFPTGDIQETEWKEILIHKENTGCPVLHMPEPPGNGRCDMMEVPLVNTVATGQNIDRLRIAAGISVKDMQLIFGFATPQAIYKWIHGTAMPTIDNLVILAAVLGVTLDEIVVVDTAARKIV